MEIIFIGCDTSSLIYIPLPGLKGAVNDDRSVEFHYGRAIGLKCHRIIYRFVDVDDDHVHGYFQRPGLLDYPAGKFLDDGYTCLSNEGKHLLVMEKGDGLEITLSDSDGRDQSICLSMDKLSELADVLCQAVAKR